MHTQMGKGGFEFRVVLSHWVRITVILVLFLGIVMVLWLCLKGKKKSPYLKKKYVLKYLLIKRYDVRDQLN